MQTSSKAPILNFLNQKPKVSSPHLKRALFVGLLATVLTGALSGCAGRTDTRGNEIATEQISEIKVGETSRDEVLSMLGSPSSTAKFGDEIWYYIFEQTETVAFLAPDVVNRQVLAVQFDEEAMVSKIGTLGLENSNEVTPVDRKTPTAGNRLSFFEQMIANFGRFNTGGEK